MAEREWEIKLDDKSYTGTVHYYLYISKKSFYLFIVLGKYFPAFLLKLYLNETLRHFLLM